MHAFSFSSCVLDYKYETFKTLHFSAAKIIDQIFKIVDVVRTCVYLIAFVFLNCKNKLSNKKSYFGHQGSHKIK